ncbi:phage tail tape measure protein [Streptomyces sp. WMMC897]|uniref:phage tail tape measure protein n=1 Tax=Streptomyces sp. WMMC897 TaxID=3014782 RepID=UPI0022B6D4AF|nr:hypothetical protein [Streptomyces sp. WMMC897]MCZ7414320.1 hypothetical protein [Streptomyces sp. WMMC897]
MAILEEILVRLGVDMSDAEEGLQEGGRRINRAMRGMAVGAGIAGAGVGLAFVEGISAAMNISAARTQLENDLGLTSEAAEDAADAMSGVFESGFVTSMAEAGEATAAVMSSMSDMRTSSIADIEEVTQSAIVLGKTLKTDVADVASGVGALVNSGLVETSKEGLDLLTAAAPAFPAAMRADLPEVIREYGDGFARIGLEGPQAFGLLSQFVKASGKDVDEAADILNEFGRIAHEEPERAAEAFRELGLPVKDTLKAIHDGGADGQRALTDITDALRDVEDGGDQAALATKIFGDRAGDSVDALLALNPETATAAGNLKDVAGAAKDAADNYGSDSAVQLQQALNTLKNTLGEALLPTLQHFAAFLQDHQGTIKALVIPALIAMVGVLGLLTAATIAWTISLLANPVVWIVLAIIWAIAIIVAWIVVIWKLITNWEAVKTKLGEIWDWLTAKLGEAWDWVVRKTREAWDWVMSKIGGAWAWIQARVAAGVGIVMGWIDDLGAIPGKVSGWFGDVVGYVRGLPGKIDRAASGMWGGITRSFKGAVNSVIGSWNRLSFTIGGGSIAGVSIPSVTLHTPNIPYLADGGITTGPTLAMIGEGREDEAVLPLSRLEHMLNTAAHAPSVSKVQPATRARLHVNVTGGDEEFRAWFRRMLADGELEIS